MYKHFVSNYNWKWVAVQHPMVLLSSDQSEPRALETVPPWGANDIPGYCEKMYEMLCKLKDTPELKIDFDLSAKELLIFLEHQPKARDLMKNLINEKRLGFTGVDYAQAHYSCARSESALRGIRMGAEVYEKELGVVSNTFQHQEVGVFQNMPQILKAYGVTKGTTFRFPACIQFIDNPPELLCHFNDFSIMQGDSMALWCGLDNSCIPMYLPWNKNGLQGGDEASAVIYDTMREEFKQPRTPISKQQSLYPTEYEEMKGLCRSGSIIMQCPDMVKIDEDYLQSRKRVGDFWLLEQALDEEIKTAIDMPRFKYYSYYSYVEGCFGEMMFKAYRSCESEILAAEAMNVLLNSANINFNFDSESAWDKLLTAQHHDINWMDHKELRLRAHGWCMQAKIDAQNYMKLAFEKLSEVSTGKQGEYITVFNSLPTKRNSLVKTEVDSNCNFEIFDDDKKIPSQTSGKNLLFYAQMHGFGTKTYRLIKKETATCETKIISEPYIFENAAIKATILPDGRISSLVSKLSGERLGGFGNVIKGIYTDDVGNSEWVSNENAANSMVLTKGEICDTLTLEGKIKHIPYNLVITLPHGLQNNISFELELEFNNDAIGDMVHDETKLNVSFELAQNKPQIYFDEPYGVVKGKPMRPIHAANFITLFNEKNKAGTVYMHEGMPKVWVSENTLYNQLAWGGQMVTNRNGKDWFAWSGIDKYDMRLNGKMKYKYSISAIDNYSLAEIATGINKEIAPLKSAVCGKYINYNTLAVIENETLIPTAIEQDTKSYIIRAYEVMGESVVPNVKTSWGKATLTDVAGRKKDSDKINGGEIAEMRYNKK